MDPDPALAADPAVEAVLGPAAEPRSARQVRFSFGSLLVTQLLGAFNDNVLKQFILLQLAIGKIWHDALGDGTVGMVNFIYAVPFILLSGYAGQFADQRSKRWVAVLLKTLEIPIVCIAGVAIHYGSFAGAIFSLILLSAHSAFFGPAKYGMIPELLPERRLPRGNGSINLTTNVAVIMGMVFGGFASDRFHGDPAAVPPIPAAPNLCFYLLLAMALAGRVSVMFIQKLEPRDPALRIHPNPFHTYVRSLRGMVGSGDLLRATFAWTFFYLLAACVLSAIPDLKGILRLRGETPTDLEISYMNAGLAVAIGLGSMAAGFVARGRISLREVLFGGFGLATGLLVFPLVPPESYPWTTAVLCLLGFSAGFYLVPLMSYIQAAAPPNARGQFLGTTNSLSFVTYGGGSLLYAGLRYAKLTPHQVLAVAGVLLLLVLAFVRKARLALPSAKERAAAPA